MEVADIEAFGVPDSIARLQWLVHMAEERVGRLHSLDVLANRGTADLEAPGDDVVVELGHLGRDMGEQNVDLTKTGDLVRIVLRGQLIRGAHGADQTTADEAKPKASVLDDLAIDHTVALAQEVRPQGRDIDISVGEQRGRGHRGEQLGVLGGHHALEHCPSLRRIDDPAPGPGGGAELAGILEAPGRAGGNVGPGVIGPEEIGVDSPLRVVVIKEEDEVAEADEQVGPVGGASQFGGSAMHIADDMDPHGATMP